MTAEAQVGREAGRRWEVYALKDPRSGEVRYVGVTFRGRQRRLTEHLSKAKLGGATHRDCWLRSLSANSIEPTYETLESGLGDSWQEAERRQITSHRLTSNLVNHTDGGEGTPGYVPTAELRQAWSNVRRGRKYPEGRRSGMLGRKHTAEAKEKIRRAGTGRRHEATARLKVSAARKGKPLSIDHRHKLSAAKKGGSLSAEHRSKIALSTKNRAAVLCVDTGETFASITAAAKKMGVNEASIYQACHKGCRCRGRNWRRI